MSLTVDIPVPIFCPSCGREITYLFCLYCMLSQLDNSAILANAKEIRALTKWPIGKTRATADCLICTKPIPAHTTARILLGRQICAHVECARQLRARLDEVILRPEPQPQAGNLLFNGVIEVD